MLPLENDTIAAIATPSGCGGVGIVRVSGPLIQKLIPELVNKSLSPRVATYCQFMGSFGEVIDEGIALYFPGPASFTGEDVLELQGHGGVVVLDMLMHRVLELGIRQARPGEFSERAFVSGKMDLAQVEAVADLVNASSVTAAKSAMRSLQGDFSERIEALVTALMQIRVYVESAIDFPEEEIDFLGDSKVCEKIQELLRNTEALQATAKQGALLREGMTVVIVGRPNAGKSSLMNALAGNDVAIVTDMPGTTRDVLREVVALDDLPLHLLDTAGLRDATDVVEREGVRRAWAEIETADRVLYVIDSSTDYDLDLASMWPELKQRLVGQEKLSIVLSKIDVSGLAPTPAPKTIREPLKYAIMPNGTKDVPLIEVSAKTGAGLGALKAHLQFCMGFYPGEEGVFSARRRHLTAIESAREHLHRALGLMSTSVAGELVAEDLRAAQSQLATITGEFTSEDLLGEIFSSFCIGK